MASAKKKKTPTEKYIDQTVKKTVEALPVTNTTISNCTVTGVQYDAETVSAITAVAKALQQNAEGLTHLAKALSGGAFTMEAGIHIGNKFGEDY